MENILGLKLKLSSEKNHDLIEKYLDPAPNEKIDYHSRNLTEQEKQNELMLKNEAQVKLLSQ
jgi:hypothetical protein